MSKTFKKLSVIQITSNFREATQVVDVPLVSPNDDQVLVRNIYAGVNATDINITAARYSPNINLPFDIGLEAMGVVEEIGGNISNVSVGQPVIVQTSKPKAYSEYLYLSADEVIPVPSLRPEFIGLLVSGLAATLSLDKAGRIQEGEKVLITAAAGGTGHICVQWAKQKGCHVIGMTSSPEKEKLLKGLGCDRVINYKTENLDEVLTKEYPEGIDVIWETIGGQVFETLFKHLSIGGRLVIVGAISGYQNGGKAIINEFHISNPTQLSMKNQSLVGFGRPGYKHLFKSYLSQLIQDIENNKLKIVLDFGDNSKDGQFIGIDSVVRGVEYLHSGKNLGKVVIKLQNE